MFRLHAGFDKAHIEHYSFQRESFTLYQNGNGQITHDTSILPSETNNLNVYFLMVPLCHSVSSISQRHTLLLIINGYISGQQLVDL